MSKNDKKVIDLFEKHCIFPTLDDKPDYIGLRITKETHGSQFVFPIKYYEVNELQEIKHNRDKLIEDITNLLNAIYKVNVSENTELGNKSANKCPIDAYFWLIRDYIENGYYIEYETVFSKDNKGKINWKKTIKNNKFYILDYNDNIDLVYSEYIIQQNTKNTNSIITQIHKYCISEAINLFGPLFGIEYIDQVESQYTLDEMLYFLKKEYNITFLDYKKTLISKMIEILEWIHDENSTYDMFSIESNKFELIFQDLIDDYFGNISDIRKYYPSSKWHIKGNEYNTSKLREDTILDLSLRNKKDKSIIIIDAKYYKYAYYEVDKMIKKLPATAEIAKQIIYGEFVKTIEKDKSIYNVFLIPYNTKNNNSIEYIGYAKSDWKVKDNNKYELIYTFKVDLKTLVNKSKSKKELLEEFLKGIKNANIIN